MKNKVLYLFTSLVIIAVAVGLYLSREWNPETALFPRVVGFPMLVLAVIILALDIKKARRQDRDRKAAVSLVFANRKAADNAEFEAVSVRMFKYFGWLIGFVVLVWAVGIVFTIPVYVFGYMKFEGKYSWLKSGIYAVAMIVFVFVLFDVVLGVAWPDGALMDLLHLT